MKNLSWLVLNRNFFSFEWNKKFGIQIEWERQRLTQQGVPDPNFIFSSCARKALQIRQTTVKMKQDRKPSRIWDQNSFDVTRDMVGSTPKYIQI